MVIIIISIYNRLHVDLGLFMFAERSPDKKSATLPYAGSNTSLSTERATRPLPPPPERQSYLDKPWYHNITREQAIILIKERMYYFNLILISSFNLIILIFYYFNLSIILISNVCIILIYSFNLSLTYVLFYLLIS